MTSANDKVVGHTIVRCKKPVDEEDGGFGSAAGGGDNGAFDTGDSMANPGAADEDDWGAAGGGNPGDYNWVTAPTAEAGTAAAW